MIALQQYNCCWAK